MADAQVKKITGERQRKRGTSFKQEYQGAAARAKGRGRAPSMLHEPTKYMIPPQSKEDRGRYTIVFDLDETLVYAREGPLYARPGLDDMFAYLRDTTETIVWTAGLRAYAQAIVRNIDKTGCVKHCVYRHAKWFTGQAGYQKDLGVLGREPEKMIIIENTPDCIRGWQQNGILVCDYEGGETPDFTIPALTQFLKGLVESGKTVPEYITTSDMLSRSPIQTDVGDFIQVYTLNINTWKPEGWSRVNRDLGK
eukprot:TRINITY_DN8827_c0_g4_i1.p1 TRINITY_DN8827_c0_g4~~TRINITY_DN8827_c0_g4_i1.p1  ORF type:complete len:284 (+),score=106.49 TRINITY_DN8827_c0_g4_i1:100-852(+)